MAKVISLRQPHAWGAVHGWKDCENRGWYTDYRGPLWIHAGKSTEEFKDTEPEMWAMEGRKKLFPGLPPWKELSYGAIIGLVDMVDCVTFEVAESRKKSIHHNGDWCFLLENARVLKKPLPWTGQLGLFNIGIEPQDEMFLPQGKKK